MKKLRGPAVIGVTIIIISLFSFFRDSLLFYYDPSLPEESSRGVIHHDKLRSQDGFNILNTYEHSLECKILDMQGQFIYQFPGGFCHFIGSKYLVTVQKGIILYRRDFSIEWQKENLVIHHDIAIEKGSNNIFALTYQYEKVDEKKIRYDKIQGYSISGSPIFSWKAEDHIDEFNQLLNIKIQPHLRKHKILNKREEYLSTYINSIDIFAKNPIENTISAFKKGNLLISFNNHSFIAIIDRATGRPLWAHKTGPYMSGVHDVQQLKNGNLLYFVNGLDSKQAYSEIHELNPISNKVVWRYRATEHKKFHSLFFGSVQRLENGNTLITHITNGGSAFEITEKGQIVWEWIHPDNNPDSKIPLDTYRVRRITKTEIKPFLDEVLVQ